MGHGHSHGGKKCQGHGHAHGQQQQQQQQPTMTYEQAMRDPVMRGKIIAKKKRAKYIRLGSQILFFLVCFSLFWFYGRSVDEYLDPPKDRPDAVKARLRAAHGGATTFQEAKQKLAKTKTQPATWLHSNAAGQTYLQNNARKEYEA